MHSTLGRSGSGSPPTGGHQTFKEIHRKNVQKKETSKRSKRSPLCTVLLLSRLITTGFSPPENGLEVVNDVANPKYKSKGLSGSKSTAKEKKLSFRGKKGLKSLVALIQLIDPHRLNSRSLLNQRKEVTTAAPAYHE